MRYLIDTNILIDHLRDDLKVTRFLNNIEKEGIVAFISVITEYEILCGQFSSEAENENYLKDWGLSFFLTKFGDFFDLNFATRVYFLK